MRLTIPLIFYTIVSWPNYSGLIWVLLAASSHTICKAKISLAMKSDIWQYFEISFLSTSWIFPNVILCPGPSVRLDPDNEHRPDQATCL
jgi:hypothetical protein